MENTKPMTKLEIIEDTVNYYSVDPVGRRAIEENGACMYLTSTGKMCAFGRCIVDPQSNWWGQCDMIYATDEKLDRLRDGKDNVKWQFKPQYEGHDIEFWLDIQKLHDDANFWTSEGLSVSGEERVKELKRRIQINSPTKTQNYDTDRS